MYLYGASGHAKVIMDILSAQGVEIEGLIDDNPNITELHGFRIIHDAAGLSPIIVSIGDNTIRKRIVGKLDCRFGTAIHPSAIVSETARIGNGSVVMQGTVIQTDAIIGKHCIINTGASVDHECVIENYVHISPHSTLCGNVKIGEGTWVGAGCTIIPGITIGKWSVIGAGSVIVNDIPDGVVAYGNSCKIIKPIKLDVKTNLSLSRSHERE